MFEDQFDVVPDVPAQGRAIAAVAKHVGRVIGGHDGDVPVTSPLSPQARDARFRIQYEFRGRPAQGDDDLRLDQVDLSSNKGRTSLQLLGLRRAIPVTLQIHGGAALDYIGDVDLASRDAHALFDNAREQFTRASHEGATGFVLGAARTFADEHDVRVFIAFAEDDLASRRGKLAAKAALRLRAQYAQLLSPHIHGRSTCSAGDGRKDFYFKY